MIGDDDDADYGDPAAMCRGKATFTPSTQSEAQHMLSQHTRNAHTMHTHLFEEGGKEGPR